MGNGLIVASPVRTGSEATVPELARWRRSNGRQMEDQLPSLMHMSHDDDTAAGIILIVARFIC